LLNKNVRRKYIRSLRATIAGIFFLSCVDIAMAETGNEEVLRRAEKIAGYLQKAEAQLAKGNFGSARGYAEKALAVDERSRKAQAVLGEVDKAERVHSEEQERLKREEEEFRRKEEEVRRKAKEEAAAQKRAEKVDRYLDNAGKQLDRKRFDGARGYAEKALAVDEKSKKARILLEEIDKAEKLYKEEQERLKREEEEARLRAEQEKEAEKRAREEERRKKKEEAAAERRAKKVAGYLDKARKQLDKNRFDGARGYARKAFEADRDNREAQLLLSQIDEAESAYEEGQERLKEKEKEPEAREEEVMAEVEPEEEAIEEAPAAEEEAIEEAPAAEEEAIEEAPAAEKRQSAEEREAAEKRARKTAEKAAKEQARKEAKRKRLEKKIDRYISKSRYYLSKKDYSGARRYAYKAREEAPESSKVAELITDIDKEEMFSVRNEEEAEMPGRIEKALKEEKEEGDIFHKYDEGKGWFDQVTGLFKKKTYELGDIQEEKIYTIDECVQLALHRSQRMVMSAKQVKLAEVRVWEARRDLFPEVTGTIERSVGKMRVRHYHGEKYLAEIKHTAFDGFGAWFEVRQAQANLDIVKLEGEKIKNEVIAETKTAYYNLDKAIKGLKVQDKLKKMVNSLHDIIEKAYQQEIVPRVEYLKVKGQNIQANFQHISSEEDVSLAEMMLFHTMNMDPEQRIRIKPVDPPGEPMQVGLENCYQLALANRPDFKIKEKTIEYYDLDRKIMKAKGWPKITFHGSFGQSFETFQPINDAGTADQERRGLAPEWFAGVKGSIPIWGNTVEYNYVREVWAPVVSAFQGTESATSYFTLKLLDDLAYFSNLQESRVGFESAKYEYLKEKNALILEVKEKYFQYKKALLQMDVAKAKVEHQQMYVDVLEERMLYGEMETSKVIEEAEKLAVDEYGLVAGDTGYYISLVELNKAVGIPDYFRPEYESREYGEWEKEVAARKTAEERAKEAKIEARRRAALEEGLRRRAEKIAGYLVQAQVFLSKNNFSYARKAAQKALQIDPENEKAKQLLTDIEKAETE